MADAISLINPSVDISSFIDIMQDKTSYTVSVSSTTPSTIQHAYSNAKYWLVQVMYFSSDSFGSYWSYSGYASYVCIIPSGATNFVIGRTKLQSDIILNISITTDSITLSSNNSRGGGSVICTPLS